MHSIAMGLAISHAPCLLGVVLYPKVREKDKEHRAVGGNDVFKSLRVHAVFVENNYVGHVTEDHDELSHLKHGKILLPPKVFLVFWSHCRESVVTVHHHVDEGVDHGVEGTEAPCGVLDAPPPSVRHESVVKDVEKGNLAEPLSGDEEVGVQEFDVLGYPEEPADAHHSQGLR